MLLRPGRTLLPNFEHRIILGIGTFVGIVLMVGWIAINEPARMDTFTQTYHARSVENGASTFVNVCATCHGVDAKGTGQGPALDNPMLFLTANPAKVAKAKIDDLTNQQGLLQGTVDDIKKLAADQTKYDAMSDAD